MFVCAQLHDEVQVQLLLGVCQWLWYGMVLPLCGADGPAWISHGVAANRAVHVVYTALVPATPVASVPLKLYRSWCCSWS